MSCTSARACVAVGSFYYSTVDFYRLEDGTAPLVEHWNGAAWSIQTIPNLGPANAPDSSLSGVWCTARTSCVAVGFRSDVNGPATVIERLDGGDGSTEPSSGRVAGRLNAVSCASTRVCVAVGSAKGGRPLVERWNGSRWSVQMVRIPAGAHDGSLGGVACVSKTTCFGVGFLDYGARSSSSLVRRALVVRFTGSRSSIQRIPHMAGSLNSVWCASKSVCMAVGGWRALRWHGERWASEPVPHPARVSGLGLRSVSCVSSRACTAVGTAAAHAGGRVVAVTERWNGVRWSLRRTPAPTGAVVAVLNGVSCTSNETCVMVGAWGNSSGTRLSLAERQDQKRWRIQRTPNANSLDDTSLAGVSCTSTNACTAVGSVATPIGYTELAERWNGATWSLQSFQIPSATPYTYSVGVSCPAGSMCMAVGGANKGAGGSGTVTLAEIWNGISWSIASTPNPPGAGESMLTGVSCTSVTACVAVGYFVDGAGDHTLAEAWNGASWRIESTPNPSTTWSVLNAVSCSSSTACIAVGQSIDATGHAYTLAERWDGRSWTTQTTPNPSPDSSLSGVSCPAVRACTAVGDFGDSEGGHTLSEAWNGASWRVENAPNPRTAWSLLNAVSCSSSTACTAVGQSIDATNHTYTTLAERWDGSTWTNETTPNPSADSSLHGVSCISLTACTAVGVFYLDNFPREGPDNPSALAEKSS